MPEDDDFNMTPVESSQIAAVGFNPETKQGKISFLKNGSVYVYDGCTQEEADQIINAPSAGTAFAGIWKGVKNYRRIG
jgi:hypothetical protein